MFHLRQGYKDYHWNDDSDSREPRVCFGLTAPLETMWGGEDNGGAEFLDVENRRTGECFGNIATYPQQKGRLMKWARDFDLIYKEDPAKRRECHWWQSWVL